MSALISLAPRLIATDLDGTLLGTDGRVSERNSAALERAAASGTQIVIATGRPVRWLHELTASIHASVAIACNGGVVVDVASGAIIESNELDGLRLRQAIEHMRTEGADFWVGVEGPLADALVVEPGTKHSGIPGVDSASLAELCSGPIVKVLIEPLDGGSHRMRDFFDTHFAGDFMVTHSSDNGPLELSRAGITKGSVLARLAAGWGIDRTESIAFGDMHNDIEMLQWAGRSIAMENANASVKAIADESTNHHDAHGVAHVLERWF